MEIIAGNGSPEPEARVLIAPEWIVIQESEKRLKRNIKIKMVAKIFNVSYNRK
jgi:hypothetical protein